MQYDLKRERLEQQLKSIVDLLNVANFQLSCIQQDNSNEFSGVYDLLYDGVLSDIQGEINAIDALLGFLIKNHKPATGYCHEGDN